MIKSKVQLLLVFIHFIIISLLSLVNCDIDQFDNKLRIKNNLNYDIVAYINSDWPDTTIGGLMQTIALSDYIYETEYCSELSKQ